MTSINKKHIIALVAVCLLNASMLLTLNFYKNLEHSKRLIDNEVIIKDLSSELLGCYFASDVLFKRYLLCLNENSTNSMNSDECIYLR